MLNYHHPYHTIPCDAWPSKASKVARSITRPIIVSSRIGSEHGCNPWHTSIASAFPFRFPRFPSPFAPVIDRSSGCGVLALPRQKSIQSSRFVGGPEDAVELTVVVDNADDVDGSDDSRSNISHRVCPAAAGCWW